MRADKIQIRFWSEDASAIARGFTLTSAEPQQAARQSGAQIGIEGEKRFLYERLENRADGAVTGHEAK